jgi:hypothetical protein
MSEPNLVKVEWAGRQLFLHQDKLEEWHSNSTDSEKVLYINTHPDIRRGEQQPVAVHRERGTSNPDDLVLIMFSGQHILLERDQLDEWYNSSFEAHLEFIKRHPEVELKN